MKRLGKLIAAVFYVLFYQVLSASGKKVFCYYESFAHRRPGKGRFLPENINPWLCTHLIYAFVDITADGSDLKPIYAGDTIKGGLYERTTALKKQNPKLKVLLAVGGWKMGSKPFMPIIQSEHSMMVWAANVIQYLRRYNFDGLDMDWEFPGIRGSTPRDKPKFTLLMKTLHDGFRAESAITGKEPLLLTLATAAGTFFITMGYEPREIIKYVDYMLLMSYNYHGGGWEKVTGHHSGLYRHKNDPPGKKGKLYQTWSINYWLAQGIPKERLIVGIPTYGMSFTLKNSAVNGVFAPSIGPGKAGEYTKEKGIMSFYEVCDRVQNRGWQRRWIESQLVPYTYSSNQWIGYENLDSIKIKSKNIMNRDLGGAFVWSVTLDDFMGVCGHGKYPLLATVSAMLIGGKSDPIEPKVTSAPHTRRPWKPRTFTKDLWEIPRKTPWKKDVDHNWEEGQKDYVDCSQLGIGIHKDPKSCRHFLLCSYSTELAMIGRRMPCANGTRFDKSLLICNHESLIAC